MLVKNVRELYTVDTISQDKGWKKVNMAVAELDDDITLKFNGVSVIEPWRCEEFKQLLKTGRVRLEFTNQQELVNRIKMMCIIDGLDESVVSNTIVEIPKEKTVEEKRIETYGANLIPFFDITGNEARIDLSRKYSQLHNSMSTNYLEYAIKELNKVQSIDTFHIDLKNLEVLTNVTESLVNLVLNSKKENINVYVYSDDENVAKEFGLYMHLATNKKYTIAERKRFIIKSIRPNTPGILIKYRKTRAVDAFGRCGKGEVVSSKIAIFRGFEMSDDSVKAKYEVFNDNTFFTRQHWLLEHDNELLSELTSEVVYIALNELGFCDEFLGSRYHFILPIQKDKSENRIVISSIDENDNTISHSCTIPERMKIVFDDWDIEYNAEALDKSIIATRELLDKLEKDKEKTLALN